MLDPQPLTVCIAFASMRDSHEQHLATSYRFGLVTCILCLSEAANERKRLVR